MQQKAFRYNDEGEISVVPTNGSRCGAMAQRKTKSSAGGIF